MSLKKTVLFFGEAVSLAHVVRPLVLAQWLDTEQYDIHFACDPRFSDMIGEQENIRFHPIRSISGEAFLDAANQGEFGLSDSDLQNYLTQDLDLLRRLKPELVISDFRPTVSIAAELEGIPHATVANAHWSPYRQLGFDSNPGMDGPPVKRSASAALNAIRQIHGLRLVKGYCELITQADFTLYPEPQDLIATKNLPRHHLFIGPLLWSPKGPKPPWWGSWDKALPIIYVTLGSTGLADQLPMLIEALQRSQVTILVATAGRSKLPRKLSGNVFTADYLPGDQAARLADVVVCNGGSASAYQALNEGTPVVSLWSNLDQYLTSNVISKTGAGLGCYAGDVTHQRISQLVTTVLGDQRFVTNAYKIRKLFGAAHGAETFRKFVTLAC